MIDNDLRALVNLSSHAFVHQATPKTVIFRTHSHGQRVQQLQQVQGLTQLGHFHCLGILEDLLVATANDFHHGFSQISTMPC